MRYIYLTFIFFFLETGLSFTQEVDPNLATLRKEADRDIKKEQDTSKWKLKKGGIFSLNLSQSSLSNWAAGGDNFSLAASTYFNYFIFKRKKNYNWDNNVDINLGYIQTTSLGSRKNDDRIDILSKYGLRNDKKSHFFTSILFNCRTQFFDGYTFTPTSSTLASSFLSPAYIVLSLGIDYKPKPTFSLFLSPFTSRWVIVEKDELANQKAYGVDSGKHSIAQIGAFATININNNLAHNLTYKGRLDLFSNYNNHPENVYVFMTNQFSFKVNKHISVSYSLDLIYDDKERIFGPLGTGARLQSKSLLGIGFIMPLSVKRIK